MKSKISKIKNAGKVIRVDNFEDGTHTRITRDFLDELLHSIITLSRKYFEVSVNSQNNDPDYPLRHQERNIYSTFAAALSNLTAFHLSEYGVKRGRPPTNTGGRVDFWAQYRGIDFLLELKRTTYSPVRGTEGTRIKETWESVSDQARGLKREAKGWSDKYVLIGLQIVLAYQGSQVRFRDRKNADPDEHSFDERFKQAAILSKRLTERARKDAIRLKDLSYSAIWVPPNEMSIFDLDDDRQEVNPYVVFNACTYSS